jgi:hypothetical protein
MKVEVYNKQNQLVALFGDDNMPLGAYPIEDYFRLHVGDHAQVLKIIAEVPMPFQNRSRIRTLIASRTSTLMCPK